MDSCRFDDGESCTGSNVGANPGHFHLLNFLPDNGPLRDNSKDSKGDDVLSMTLMFRRSTIQTCQSSTTQFSVNSCSHCMPSIIYCYPCCDAELEYLSLPLQPGLPCTQILQKLHQRANRSSKLKCNILESVGSRLVVRQECLLTHPIRSCTDGQQGGAARLWIKGSLVLFLGTSELHH